MLLGALLQLQLHLVIIHLHQLVVPVIILNKVPRHLGIIHPPQDIIHRDIGDLLQHLHLDIQKDIIPQVEYIILLTHTNLHLPTLNQQVLSLTQVHI